MVLVCACSRQIKGKPIHHWFRVLDFCLLNLDCFSRTPFVHQQYMLLRVHHQYFNFLCQIFGNRNNHDDQLVMFAIKELSVQWMYILFTFDNKAPCSAKSTVCWLLLPFGWCGPVSSSCLPCCQATSASRSGVAFIVPENGCLEAITEPSSSRIHLHVELYVNCFHLTSNDILDRTKLSMLALHCQWKSFWPF